MNLEQKIAFGGERATQPAVSVVVPCHNEEKNVPVLFAALLKELGQRPYELIFVDDGSTDGTLGVLRDLAGRDRGVSYISLSRNFGHQLALRAGLDAASGDCVISLDADMQHPPELIPEMLKRWSEGFDVVLTRRRDSARTPLFKRLTSGLYYFVLQKTFGAKIVQGAADFRLLDRAAVEALREFRDPAPFYRGLIGLIGFRQTILEYDVGERLHGQSKYSLRRMVSLARSGIVSSTVLPLRFSFVFSAMFLLFFLGYAAYVLFIAIFGDSTITGWASVALLLSLIGFTHSLSLAILSEYVAQIAMSTRGRPSYIIRERTGGAFADERSHEKDPAWRRG
ncbi:MAG: glycosyltransferase family 2 protein [Parvularculaceae bacterium]